MEMLLLLALTEKATKTNYSFVAKSPVNTTNVMRILLPAAPKKSTIQNVKGETPANPSLLWDATSNTCLVGFENDPDGITVSIEW